MKYHHNHWADVHTSVQSNIIEELILLHYNPALKTKLKTNKQNPTEWFLIFHPTCFNSFCYSELSSIQSCLALKLCSAHSRQHCLHIDVLCSFIPLCIFFFYCASCDHVGSHCLAKAYQSLGTTQLIQSHLAWSLVTTRPLLFWILEAFIAQKHNLLLNTLWCISSTISSTLALPLKPEWGLDHILTYSTFIFHKVLSTILQYYVTHFSVSDC